VGRALGCPTIPTRLDQNIEDIAVLVDSSPYVNLAALDLHEHLVQIPEIAQAAFSALQPAGVLTSELPTPQPNRLIADGDAALGQQILDTAEAQAEAVVQPDSVADDLFRAGIGTRGRWMPARS